MDVFADVDQINACLVKRKARHAMKVKRKPKDA